MALFRERKYFYTLDEFQADVEKNTGTGVDGIDLVHNALAGIHEEAVKALKAMLYRPDEESLERMNRCVGRILQHCARYAMGAGKKLEDIAEESLRESD